MNPVDKSRRLDGSIHHSKLQEIWDEAARNGEMVHSNLDTLLSLLEKAVVSKCYSKKNLYDVIFYVAVAASIREEASLALDSFFKTLIKEGVVNPTDRLPYFLEDLAYVFFVPKNFCFSFLTKLGTCCNVAGLHAAVVNGDVQAVITILGHGIVPTDETVIRAAQVSSLPILILVAPFLNADLIHLIVANPVLSDVEFNEFLNNVPNEWIQSQFLITLLKKKFFISLQQLLRRGHRFDAIPQVRQLEDGKCSAHIARLFLRNIGYMNGGVVKGPIPADAFNLDVLVNAYENIEQLSFNHLKRASRVNPELYYYLITQKVINAWALNGCFKNPASKGPIDSTVGFETAVSYLFWLQFFSRYANNQKDPKINYALEALEEILLEDYLPEFSKLLMVSTTGFITGDKSHAVLWIQFGDFLIYGNRGFEYSDPQKVYIPGITILQLPPNYQFSEELFDWLLYTGDRESKDAPYLENVKKKIPVKEVVHFKLKEQDADKCSEIVLKLATLIFFMIYELKGKSHIDKADWEKAFADSRPLYKHVTTESRIHTLEGLLGELSTWTGSHVDSQYPIEILLQIASKIINHPLQYKDYLNRVLTEVNRLI